MKQKNNIYLLVLIFLSICLSGSKIIFVEELPSCAPVSMIYYDYYEDSEKLHLEWDDPDPASALHYLIEINEMKKVLAPGSSPNFSYLLGPIVEGMDIQICVTKFCTDGSVLRTCGKTIVFCEESPPNSPEGMKNQFFNPKGNHNQNYNGSKEIDCCIIATSGNVSGFSPCPKDGRG